MLRRAWWVSWLCGCPAPNDGAAPRAAACAVGDLSLTLGVADGDTVPMVREGPDRWSIDLSGLVAHAGPEVSVLPALRSESLGIELVRAGAPEPQVLAGWSEAGCTGAVAIRASLDTDRPSGASGQDLVCALAGETVTLSVAVTDLESGRETSDAVDVVLASDPGDGCGCSLDGFAVAVGTGVEAYEPLAEGDPVTMVHGPQGGWHVDVAGRVSGSEPEISVLPAIRSDRLGLRLAGAQPPNYLALTGWDEGTCDGTFSAVRAYLDTDPPDGPTGQDFVCALAGETVTLSVEATGLDGGSEATGEVDVVLALDRLDIPSCP